jgi:hypothetical protein
LDTATGAETAAWPADTVPGVCQQQGMEVYVQVLYRLNSKLRGPRFGHEIPAHVVGGEDLPESVLVDRLAVST